MLGSSVSHVSNAVCWMHGLGSPCFCLHPCAEGLGSRVEGQLSLVTVQCAAEILAQAVAPCWIACLRFSN